MKIYGTLLIALALVAGACGHNEQSKQLAALDSAYQSGVITKSEFDAKKAALAQLAALDKARDAGLLTAEEYQARKQNLAAVLPAPPPATVSAPASAPVAAAPETAPVPAAIPASAAAAPSSGTRPDHIFDSSLNINAFDVSVPAGWRFDGVYVPGSSCVQIPFPVFRMHSPDGLTEIRRFPRFDWSWSTSKFKPNQQSDCLDVKQEMTAEDFLKYFIAMTQVAFVRDYPIPQATRDAYQKNIDQANAMFANGAQQADKMAASLPNLKNQPKAQPMTQTGAIAAAIAEYHNGTFTIEESIHVDVRCTHNPINFGPERGAFNESCSATVRVLRAPKGQLDALIARDSSEHFGARENPDWVSRYLESQQQKAKAFSDRMLADSNARMRQQHNDFERGQAMRQRQHEEFLSTMQQGTNRAMARAQQASQARSTMTSDWCDYALDRQTVSGAGGTVKISNAYNYTWTDGSGNYYQTNDANTNPNGTFKGNWSMTTQVHGDGTAK